MSHIDEFVDGLDLHGVTMLQGLLVNRALKLVSEQEKKIAEAKILAPEKKLIL